MSGAKCGMLPSPAGGRRVGDEGVVADGHAALYGHQRSPAHPRSSTTLTPTLSRLRERGLST